MSVLSDLYEWGRLQGNGGVHMRDTYRDLPSIVVLNTYQC